MYFERHTHGNLDQYRYSDKHSHIYHNAHMERHSYIHNIPDPAGREQG